MVGVGISALALVVVLSVFNGIESLVSGMYSALDTDLRVVPLEGKGFNLTEADYDFLGGLDTAVRYGQVLAENALFGYNERQHVGELLGIDDCYAQMVDLGHYCIDGDYALWQGSQPLAVLGAGVAYYMGATPHIYTPIQVFVPNRLARNWMNPQTAFRKKLMAFRSVVSLNGEFDEKTVVVPIGVVRALLDYDSTYVTALPVRVGASQTVSSVQKALEAQFGGRCRVLTHAQQNASMYRTMKSERLIIFLILSLILVIATFNVVGSLSMLIIDKRDDMATLQSLGATPVMLRRIFLWEGLLISGVGGGLGVLLGLLICWLQESYGLVGLQGSRTFAVDAYPVEVHVGDIALIYALVLLLGYCAAWLTTQAIRGKMER